MVATIVSGGSITATGLATPLEVGGTTIATIAAGLIYTLDIGTSSGKWIGYQILAGLGYGGAFQIPIIIAQATATPADLAEVTAIVLFSQTVGGAFLISAAQSAFVNVMLKVLPFSAPDVNPGLLIATGATQLRTTFTPDQVSGILLAYMAGLKIVFALALAATGIALCVSACNRWKRLNKEAVKAGGAAA